MPYRIELTVEADVDLQHLRKHEEARVRGALRPHLAHEPAAPSHTRKPLEPNPFGAGWQLRLGDLRVLYAIVEPAQTVEVLRVGRKRGNRLYLRGVPVETRLE